MTSGRLRVGDISALWDPVSQQCAVGRGHRVSKWMDITYIPSCRRPLNPQQLDYREGEWVTT